MKMVKAIEHVIKDENPDETIFDRRDNTYLALRHVSWNGQDTKLEMRKWFVNRDQTEIPTKGITFLTNEGPNNLVHMLISQGYGDTEYIRQLLNERESNQSNNILKFSVDDLMNNISNTGE